MPRVSISVRNIENVGGGFCVVATFSDNRPHLKGPVESREEADSRIELIGEALALSIIRSIAAGEDASLVISGARGGSKAEATQLARAAR